MFSGPEGNRKKTVELKKQRTPLVVEPYMRRKVATNLISIAEGKSWPDGCGQASPALYNHTPSSWSFQARFCIQPYHIRSPGDSDEAKDRARCLKYMWITCTRRSRV